MNNQAQTTNLPGRRLGASGPEVAMLGLGEPPRVFRRLFGLSHAASFFSLSVA